jgi:hypothetical protein
MGKKRRKKVKKRSKMSEKRDHKRGQKTVITIEMVPVFGTWALGMAIFYFIGWQYSLTYFVYCLFATFWMMRFICAYCVKSRTGTCPSGQGQVSHRLFAPGPPKYFGRQFKRNIGIQFPIWFLPLVAAGHILYYDYSHLVLVLTIIFCVVAFVILPLNSKKNACDKCPMRKQCPWSGG